MVKKYRAGVIGRTGRGNYGHGLDQVYLEMDEVEIVHGVCHGRARDATKNEDLLEMAKDGALTVTFLAGLAAAVLCATSSISREIEPDHVSPCPGLFVPVPQIKPVCFLCFRRGSQYEGEIRVLLT